MSLLDTMRVFLQSCPYLDHGKINANYLSDHAVEYTVETETADPILKRYTDGGTLRQFVFAFAARLPYDACVADNVAAAQFLEAFSCWVENQSRAHALPALESGNRADALEVLSGGYLFDADGKTARYQIQLRLIYYQN